MYISATAETGIVKGQEVEIKEEADPEIGKDKASLDRIQLNEGKKNTIKS